MRDTKRLNPFGIPNITRALDFRIIVSDQERVSPVSTRPSEVGDGKNETKLGQSSCKSKPQVLHCAKGNSDSQDKSVIGMKGFFYRFCCVLVILAGTLFFSMGCAPVSRNTVRQTGAKPPHREERRKQSVPAVPFEADQYGNVVVDLTLCPALDENRTAVEVDGTPLGRPIVLTHLMGNIYYALDSRCGRDTCTAVVASSEIICPCDSTHYDFSGAAVEGGGRRPLRELPSLLNGNRISITLK
jgi:hypothetical protein